MTSYRYQPGSAHLVVGSGGGVLTPDAALALQLWPLIERGAPLAALLEEALRNGLAQLPDLVLFELESATARVVVRGKRAVRVRCADGSDTQISGDAVRTWNEQVLMRPSVLAVGPDDGADGLPIAHGVVLADGFRWSAADAGEPEKPGVPQPAALRKHAAQEPVSPAALAASFRLAAPTQTPTQAPTDAAEETPASTPAVTETVAPELISVPPDLSTRHATPTLPDTRIEPIDDSFEHLFESTVMRSVEDAAVRAADEPIPVAGNVGASTDVEPDVPNPFSERRGDHDGSTIMAGQLAAVLASTGDPTPAAAGPRGATLVLSTGQRVEVDRGVVIGRRPQVDRVSGAEIPHLVTVPSPQQDISRSHVAVRPSGDGFLAVDLGSTNGSVIRRVDGAAQLLREGAMSDLQFGDVLDLGDGVTAVLLAGPLDRPPVALRAPS